MLKGLDPVLVPELLHALASMGHGDVVAIVDTNFPSDSVARRTVHGQAIHLAGVDVVQAMEAVLSVLPLDHFGIEPVLRMASPSTGAMPEVQVAVQGVVDRADPQVGAAAAIERDEFYEAAGRAYAIVASGERRLYGCFLLRKGVIEP